MTPWKAVGSSALLLLLLGAAEPPATAEKKPVTPVVPAAPDKKPATPVDTFEDEPTEPVQKTADGTKAPVVKNGPKVLVLPLHPIYRSVAQNKIQTANDLLLKELDQKELQVIRGGVAAGEVKAPSLEGAQKATEEAVKAEKERQIQAAIAARKKAIEEMEKNAAAVDADDYVLAHHYLARVLMWSGDDKAAADTLESAARMRPRFSLEPAEFSRLYRKWFQKAGEKAMAEKTGDLMVRSGLPGATISLDGRPMDVAPVLLKKVVPGKHLLGAKVEGVPVFAAIVEVKPTNKNEYTVAFANTVGGTAVGVVADAIAENAIPKKAVESAAAAGREAGAAYVVIGGLAKDDDRFKVHTFVVDAGKSSIQPLEVVDFDLEMLTAESDVLRVVQSIHATVSAFGSKDTSVQLIERRISKQPTMNEVAAAPSLTDDGSKRTADAAEKKAREVFKPLKSGNVTIKDEEDD